MESIGFEWNLETRWDKNYYYAEEFYQTHGHSLPTKKRVQGALKYFSPTDLIEKIKITSQDLRVSWQQQCRIAFKSAAGSMNLWHIVFYIYYIAFHVLISHQMQSKIYNNFCTRNLHF